LVSVAGNALFSAAHPGAHAEMNALAAMRAAISDGGLEIREWPGVSGVAFGPDPAVYRRPAGAVTTHAQISLYTTLEPCPMCTVALLNAGVNRVVVALADEQAGTLAPQRLSALPSVWPQLASERGLQVEFMDNDEAIAQQLGSILERSKPEADARLSRRGVLADTLADISEVRGDG
jgi:tRNA(Arg) A34 adenosine deaminase TadA